MNSSGSDTTLKNGVALEEIAESFPILLLRVSRADVSSVSPLVSQL